MKFSHLKNKKVNMVDVSDKGTSERIAKAKSEIVFSKHTFEKVIEHGSEKGEIFNTARCAGILAAKKTSDLIPLCHNININSIEIDFKFNKKMSKIEVTATAKSNTKTGVEMEALTACSVASLTIYDMCKSIDKKISITDIKLTYKTGGKTGTFKNDKL